MRFFVTVLLLFTTVSTVFAKPSAVASVFPLYNIASVIAQGEVNLRLLVAAGVDPHTFQPRPADVAEISSADLFFYISEDFEPWAGRFAGRAGRAVSFANPGALHICDGEHKHNHGGDGFRDPHIWTDPEEIPRIIEIIRDNLARLLPERAQFFEENARALTERFIDLDLRYKEQFSKISRREVFFAGHNSFSAFAQRYDLRFIPVTQSFSSSAEPSPRQVAQIIVKIRESGVEYIFYDALKSRALAETIAHETGVEILPLFSVHTVSPQDFERRISFFEFMQKNYENLFRGL